MGTLDYQSINEEEVGKCNAWMFEYNPQNTLESNLLFEYRYDLFSGHKVVVHTGVRVLNYFRNNVCVTSTYCRESELDRAFHDHRRRAVNPTIQLFLPFSRIVRFSISGSFPFLSIVTVDSLSGPLAVCS